MAVRESGLFYMIKRGGYCDSLLKGVEGCVTRKCIA
jgi:hypothetical protein